LLIGPGHLEFRRVVEAEPLASSPPGTGSLADVHSGDPHTPATFAALDCANPQARVAVVRDVPGEEVVACDRLGTEKYHLAMAKVVGTDVKGATTSTDQLGTQIDVLFTGDGQSRFTHLTRETFGAPLTRRP